MTTTRINPMVVDATGALAAVEGAAYFTRAARLQINKLVACTKTGLRWPTAPIIREVGSFEAAIVATIASLQVVVEEHVGHCREQRRFAEDPNLARALVDYLDALKRHGVGAVGAPAASGGATAQAGVRTYEIRGTVRGPREAAQTMRDAADALALGQGAVLRDLRDRLIGPQCRLPADSTSPLVLAKVSAQLVALGKAGHTHATEFARQMDTIRSLPKALRETQYGTGGWADPRNLF